MQAHERIGRYTLLARLGTGAAGEVWEAVLEGPVGFRKRVALKLVPAAKDAGALRREARLGALLRHPNIVDVYEMGRTGDGRLFLAMELVPGPNLGLMLKLRGAMEGPALREVGVQLARGLGYAHRLKIDGERVGLVHRDVKPTNVLLDPAGVVKIADLGIARLAGNRAKTIEGTPGYLAPEQLDGAAPAPAADVFSVGMVLWAMAVGKTPVRGGKGLAQALRSAMTAQSKALRARSVLSDAVPGLDNVVLTCLDPDPAGRYPDGRALRDALLALPEPAGAGLLEAMADLDEDSTASGASEAPVTERTSQTTGLRPEQQSFHGRQRERDAVEEALGHDGSLVTLKGMAGIGKTRLANHLSHRAAATGTRVMWADVGAAASEAGLEQSVASALGIPLDAAEAEGALSRALRDCGPSLLVLDRIEDVLPAVVRALSGWRTEARELRVLCTTRQALRVPGEVVVELGPLAAEEAVNLFQERAVRQLPASSAADVVELVKRLDHHPLAIELVAARTSLLEVEQLLRRLDAMSLGDDALEQAISESWQELGPWSQLAVVQLSAFRGTFPVQAAEAVVDVSLWDDAPWPLDLIDDLWQRSMLYVRHTRHGPRLGLASAMRAFAVRNAGDVAMVTDAVRGAERRHGEWYGRMGDAARLEALRTADGATRVRELALDLEDLIAALERAVDRGDVATAESVGLAAAEVLVRRGPRPRAEKVLRAVLELEGLQRRDHGLLLLSQVVRGQSLAEREELWAEALSASPTPRRRARVLALRARQLAATADEPALALEAVDACEAAVKASGDGIALTWLTIARGVALRLVGRIPEGRQAMQDAIHLAERLGAIDELASANLSLGNLLYNLGEYEQAHRGYRRAEKLFRKLGNKSSVASAIANQALIHNARADWDKGVAACKAAEQIGRSIGDRRSVLGALSKMGSGLSGRGENEEALAVYREVCDLARELSSWRTLAMALCNLTHTFSILGRGEEGLPLLHEAAEVARRIRSPRTESLAEGNLGILHTDARRLEEARSHLDIAVELAVGLDPRFEGGFRAARARRDVLAGVDPSEDLLRAKGLLARVGEKRELAKLTVVEAMWLARQGQDAEARRLLATLVADEPVLRRRIQEARRFLRGL